MSVAPATLIDLDGQTIRDDGSFHAEIVRQMDGRDDFPHFYGRNGHALFDVFTGMVETPIVLRLRNAQTLRQNCPDVMQLIESVTRMTQEFYQKVGSPEKFTFEESADQEAM